MTFSLILTRNVPTAYKTIIVTLLSCCLITLSSFIRVPFYPVPFTLHTFSIFTLALLQSPRQSFLSMLCYLICASVGLPVFGGKSNLLWICSPVGGYMIGLLIASYITSRLKQRLHTALSVIIGHCFLYLGGFLGLIPFLGVRTALMKGVIFFIPAAILKGFMTIGLVTIWSKWKQ